MSNRVNPPKQLVLPPEVQSNVQLRKAFDDLNFIVFQLWKRTGSGSDFVDGNQSDSGFNYPLAKLFDIRQQIGSGKPVTIDTTGFTIDTDEQTIDMTEV